MRPTEIGPEDADAVLAAGVSADALRDAIYVCGLFNMIDRVADALGIEALPAELAERGAKLIVDAGY